jgi:hypothetical protein
VLLGVFECSLAFLKFVLPPNPHPHPQTPMAMSSFNYCEGGGVILKLMKVFSRIVKIESIKVGLMIK